MFITHEVTYFTQKSSPVKGQWKVKGGIVFYSNDTVKRNISFKGVVKNAAFLLKMETFELSVFYHQGIALPNNIFLLK